MFRCGEEYTVLYDDDSSFRATTPCYITMYMINYVS